MNLSKVLLGTFVALGTTQAHAFITVIDVTGPGAQTSTIQNPSDFDYDNLAGKQLTYRGRGEEAAKIFKKMAEKALPQGLSRVTTEVNEATGTIAVITAVQGFFGWDYGYWVIRKTGD